MGCRSRRVTSHASSNLRMLEEQQRVQPRRRWRANWCFWCAMLLPDLAPGRLPAWLTSNSAACLLACLLFCLPATSHLASMASCPA